MIAGGLMMTSMNVSLPEPMKRFVEEQVEQGAYSTPSEYVRALIREAQAKAERKALEAKLLAGLESPVSEKTAQDWAALRQRILERSPELADE
jgi:antitoxin ParD1/3/4